MSRANLQSLSAAWGLDIRAEDLERAISHRNPKASHAKIVQLVELIGRMAEVTEIVARSRPGRPHETQVGAGLGESLGETEGARRLSAFASPLRLEDWAGECAGPGEISGRFGIARSTLDEWRRAGAAIGLLAGVRKHVFPLAQFVDGRPVEGLAEVAAIVGDARSAWLWLVEPGPRGTPTMLERLRRGERAMVLTAAREDFA